MSNPHNVPVLMYHHVAARGGSLTVGVDQFDSQMHGLAKNGYRSLRAEEFADFMAGRPLPAKSVLITFDDGYLDNWVYAHPVLQKYGLTAVLFTITGLIGDGAARPFYGQGGQVPACPPHDQAKAQMFGNNRDNVMLRWDEIDAMRAAGTFEIHSHTHTHTRWDLECESANQKAERLHQDLEASRQTLQDRLGGVSSHLCWPQGYFDDDYKRVAANLGFEHLYTTDARGQNRPHGDKSHIYRFAVRNRPYSWLGQRLWLAAHPTLGPIYNTWKARSDAKKARRKGG